MSLKASLGLETWAAGCILPLPPQWRSLLAVPLAVALFALEDKGGL